MAQIYSNPRNLVDWLDDICVRFIVNLPREELESVQRIMFQIEEGHWYYEDFIRPLDPTLPSINLKQFCALVFHHCPLLATFSHYHAVAYAEFSAYKTRVPVRGAIMLNQDMSKAVLVKGWKKGAKWSFPRGKINKDESDFDCAVREVYEETGYDLRAAGVATDEASSHHLEVTLREQQMRLYVFRGVPMDTHFEPLTRKEISKIEWYNISDLPGGKSKKHIGPEDVLRHNQFYMVTPFIGELKNWIKQQRKKEKLLAGFIAPDVARVDDSGVGTDMEAMAPELAHRDAAEARHFDSLLSRLNKSTLSTAPTQQDESVAQTDDLAAQLKRLLSVGGGPEAAREPSQVPAVPQSGSTAQGLSLLSLLQSSSQIPRPQPQSHIEAYSAGYSPEQMRARQSQEQAQHMQHSINGPGHGFTPTASYNNTHPLATMRHDTQPHPQGAFDLQQQQWPQAAPLTGPNPSYAQPQFQTHTPVSLPDSALASLNSSFPNQAPHMSNTNHYQAPPPAASLPKPNLTAHSLSLLNAFNGQQASPNPSAVRDLPSQPSAFVSPQLQQNDMPQNGAVSLLQALNGPPQAVHPAQSQARSTQASALLNLFQSPGNDRHVPAIGSAARPAELAPPVAELAAGSPRGAKFDQRHAPDLSTPKQPLTINSAVPHDRGPPQLTSATVSGPLNAPNFGSIIRNIPPVELGASEEPSITPVPVHSVSPGMPLEAPRAMHHPSILNRQTTPANAAILNSQSKATADPTGLPLSFDKRATMPANQKTALMSLFGKQTVQVVKEATARQQQSNSGGVALNQQRAPSQESPVSPLPVRAVPNDSGILSNQHASQSQPSLKKVSRVSSLADETLASASGAKSPVTPVEQQNFLMQYLQNVVTNEGRG